MSATPPATCTDCLQSGICVHIACVYLVIPHLATGSKLVYPVLEHFQLSKGIIKGVKAS